MLRTALPQIKRLALVAIGLLVAAGSASAQQGWPINGSGWSYRGGPSGGSPSYSAPSGYSSPYTPSYSNYGDYAFPAAGQQTQNVSSYQSFYNAGNMRGDRSVLVNVRLPTQAQLWIENVPMTANSGSFRQFQSPVLETGYKYSYEIRARWMENGQSVERTRKVTFQPGQQVNVDFSAVSGSGS